MKRISAVLAVFTALFAVVFALAGEENLRFHDRNRFLVHTGTTDVDISASDYTAFVALLTIEPASDVAMHDVKIYLDLDKATTGYDTIHSDAGTTTGQLVVSRKVDGTNWRQEVASITTLTSGAGADTSASALRMFDLGTVGPTEDVRVEVKLSAEVGDFEVPYSVTYRSSASATFTEVAN